MDIRMPELDGLEAARRIIADGVAAVEPPRILMLTTFDRDEYVYEALRAGASGFLLKDTPPEQLVAAIHVVAAGEALLAPSITRRVIAEFVKGTGPDAEAQFPRLDDLTARESEVLGLIARGLSNAEIAKRAVRVGDDGEDPRRPHPDEARPARPGAGRRPRLRSGRRPTRRRPVGRRPARRRERRRGGRAPWSTPLDRKVL